MNPPHGFIKYNLNGKKLKMIGLKRNHTVVTLYSMLYNFRRLISVKLNDDKKINGILLQSPIPNHLNINEAFKTISYRKDVEIRYIPFS